MRTCRRDVATSRKAGRAGGGALAVPNEPNPEDVRAHAWATTPRHNGRSASYVTSWDVRRDGREPASVTPSADTSWDPPGVFSGTMARPIVSVNVNEQVSTHAAPTTARRKQEMNRANVNNLPRGGHNVRRPQ